MLLFCSKAIEDSNFSQSKNERLSNAYKVLHHLDPCDFSDLVINCFSLLYTPLQSYWPSCYTSDMPSTHNPTGNLTVTFWVTDQCSTTEPSIHFYT